MKITFLFLPLLDCWNNWVEKCDEIAKFSSEAVLMWKLKENILTNTSQITVYNYDALFISINDIFITWCDIIEQTLVRDKCDTSFGIV